MEIQQEKLKTWLNEPKHLTSLREWVSKHNSSPPKPMKSATDAESFRKNGNDLFRFCNGVEDFHEAFAYYSKSIAHAPLGSRELGLAYSNLSAVLFRIGKHTECVQSIDCCLNCDYPEASKLKLFLRKIECLKIIGEPEKAKEVYQRTLSWIETSNEKKAEAKKKLKNCFKQKVVIQKPITNEDIDRVWSKYSIKSFNEEIPGVSDALSLQYSESQGRHYVATRDIQPCEMLLKDRPYAMLCVAESRYKCCWECCKSFTNCIPCDHCKYVVFCSEKCKQASWKDYHHVECKLLEDIFRNAVLDVLIYNDMLVAAIRVLILAVKEYGSVQEVRKAVNEMEQSTDPRTKGFADGRLLVDKYLGFLNLQTSSDIYSDINSFEKVTLIYQIATNSTLLGKYSNPNWEELSKDEDFIFASCALGRHMDIVCNNRTNVERAFFWTGRTRTTCLSIPACLFNHSCVPNAFIVQTKEYSKVVCHRFIKKGEQVFLDYYGICTYDGDTKHCPSTTKHSHLRRDYGVRCKCEACTNEWPMLAKYPNRFDDPNPYSDVLISVYETVLGDYKEKYDIELKSDPNVRNDFKSMIEMVDKISKGIQILDGIVLMPCQEFFFLQMCMLEFILKLHCAYM